MNAKLKLRETKISQARPMAIWCILALSLAAIVVAMGVTLFFTPGQQKLIPSKGAPSSLTQ
jgi:hypothetical protein